VRAEEKQMRWVGKKRRESRRMLDTTTSCQPLPKIPFASEEVSRKMLKVDKVAFWVDFFVFAGICNTSSGSHTAACPTEVPATVSRVTQPRHVGGFWSG